MNITLTRISAITAATAVFAAASFFGAGTAAADQPLQPADKLAPNPHCVQIHKDFQCPEDEEPKEPEKDGVCKMIAVQLGEPPVVDPDCEDDSDDSDGLCLWKLGPDHKEPVYPDDPDCQLDEDPGPDEGPEKPEPGEHEILEPDGVCMLQVLEVIDPDCERPDDDEPVRVPDDRGEEPEDRPEDEPQDEPGDEPQDEPDDEPADEPQDDSSEDTLEEEPVVPLAPDSGAGNAMAGGLTPTTVYGALGLAIAGGILGGAALSLGRKS